MTHAHDNRGAAQNCRSLMLATIMALSAGILGCQKTLFSPREGRSQFDSYDMSRDQHPPQFIEDEFGRRTPNLRGRLGQRN